MRKLLILSVMSLCSTIAVANSSIFSCTTNEGKDLSVQKSGDDYVLSYGNISFKNSIKSVMSNSNTEIAGGSGFTTYSLGLKNGEYDYSIGYIEPKGNSKELIEPGGTITKNEAFVDIMVCNPNKKITVNFDKKLMRKTGFAK